MCTAKLPRAHCWKSEMLITVKSSFVSLQVLLPPTAPLYISCTVALLSKLDAWGGKLSNKLKQKLSFRFSPCKLIFLYTYVHHFMLFLQPTPPPPPSIFSPWSFCGREDGKANSLYDQHIFFHYFFFLKHVFAFCSYFQRFFFHSFNIHSPFCALSDFQ